MAFIDKLEEIRRYLCASGFDGWLIYDFRGTNAGVYPVLDIPSDRLFTRRFFYWIPQKGDPVKIVSFIEPHTLDHLPGVLRLYRTRQELEQTLQEILVDHNKIAMEYSPGNAIPVISTVDAGTVDLIRKYGVEVCSSAEILQKFTAVWTEEQLTSHLAAAEILDEIAGLAWHFIRDALAANSEIDEYRVQQFMWNEMLTRGCIADHAPICAVNAHAADPHYSPEKNGSFIIRRGDFILLDLWCKKTEPGAVYADIARVGLAAEKPTALQRKVFETVKAARKRTIDFIVSRYEKNEPIHGWQPDRICRDFIQESGFGEYFTHRTGHNIGERVHGSGANLDDFETHDFRLLLPGTCFSVEPGIYLPGQFGVRLECDVYLHPSGRVMVTGGMQEEIVYLSE